jgi:hypothetical protein
MVYVCEEAFHLQKVGALEMIPKKKRRVAGGKLKIRFSFLLGVLVPPFLDGL